MDDNNKIKRSSNTSGMQKKAEAEDLINRQQEEIERLNRELKNSNNYNQQIDIDIDNNSYGRAPYNNTTFMYSEFWKLYVIIFAVAPPLLSCTIIGLPIAALISVVGLFLVGLPVLFCWPFGRTYGRHLGKKFWVWASYVYQVVIIVGYAISCISILPIVFLPSIYKYNKAIALGRTDRVLEKATYINV